MVGPVVAADFLEEERPVAGKYNVPSWLKSFLDSKGAEQIEQKVRQAETKTQAEIVPMIVRSSSTKGFLPFQIFLLCAVVILLFFRDLPYFGAFIALAAAFPFSILLAQIPVVQRWLIPKEDQIQDVYHRAHFEFFEKKLSGTKQKTGVLIFVSLVEHRCIILADETIAKEVVDETWEKAVQLLLEGIRSKKASEGFCKAIDFCSDILSQKFPAQRNNEDEIENHLIIEE